MIGKIYERKLLAEELPRIRGRHKDGLALAAFCPPFGFFQIQTFVELPANGTLHTVAFHNFIHLLKNTNICSYLWVDYTT